MVWTHHRLFGGWGCGGMRSPVLIASYHSEASNWPRDPLIAAVIARLSSAGLQCRPDSCCYSKASRPQSHGMSVTVQNAQVAAVQIQSSCSTDHLLHLRLSSRLLSSLFSVWASLLPQLRIARFFFLPFSSIRFHCSWAGTLRTIPWCLTRSSTHLLSYAVRGIRAAGALLNKQSTGCSIYALLEGLNRFLFPLKVLFVMHFGGWR